MQYQLSIRKITESDLSVYRPFMPENENYEMYLSAFVEDINNLEFVSKLQQNGSDVIVTIENDSDFEQLDKAAKKLLSGSYYDKLVLNKRFTKVV
ncbi:hypothetical protein [Psychrobacter sp. Pi2-51]|uniref:hypothetical protein n=1 Tax=unclassified Psychrobacter TaxID=196806 RepID=UPI001919F669|nr:hypothetical protein [Psychrobacter sp. Pi2-51]